MRIEFLGATRSVTGSRYIVHVNGKRILLECGLAQGHRLEAYAANKNLPFEASAIDAVILSHAHIDHSGNLPTLHARGFNNSIYCTVATLDLCSIMLPDSAHIQERDLQYLRKKIPKTRENPVEPLYTVEDAQKVLRHFVGIGYNRWVWITDTVRCVFHDAGHILGSAVVVLEIKEGQRTTRLAFTGDLGHRDVPILRDPEAIHDVDVLITESTYGNRIHDPADRLEEEFANVVNRTIARGGKIIVPAFSVGRTQHVVYLLHRLCLKGAIPAVPVFVDSPLSVNATEVFKMHPECYDEEAKKLFEAAGPEGIFGAAWGFGRVEYVESLERSKALNDRKDPCIIISASGMCEAGRILHHLKNNIEDERNTIMVVGFMAEGTLGKRLVDREPKVKLLGEKFQVRAEIAVFNALSAHADKNGLLGYVKAIGSRVQKAFVVHGEEEQSLGLAEEMRRLPVGEVIVPKLGESFEA